MAINIAFIIPILGMLSFVVANIQKDIRVSSLEIKGNDYQRVVVQLMILALESKYDYYTDEKAYFNNKYLTEVAYKKLEDYNSKYGKDLKIEFSDLASRNKQYIHYQSLYEEWKKLKSESEKKPIMSQRQNYMIHI